MAAIKSYTTIEQSRKLAEILPLESADMHYCLENRDVATGYEIGIVPFIQTKRFKGKCNIVDVRPAWSLAALLGVLPEGYSFVLTKSFDGENYYCKLDGKPIETTAGNPIDACVAIIEKLHELKML